MVANVNIFGMYMKFVILSKYNCKLVIRKKHCSFELLVKNLKDEEMKLQGLLNSICCYHIFEFSCQEYNKLLMLGTL